MAYCQQIDPTTRRTRFSCFVGASGLNVRKSVGCGEGNAPSFLLVQLFRDITEGSEKDLCCPIREHRSQALSLLVGYSCISRKMMLQTGLFTSRPKIDHCLRDEVQVVRASLDNLISAFYPTSSTDLPRANRSSEPLLNIPYTSSTISSSTLSEDITPHDPLASLKTIHPELDSMKDDTICKFEKLFKKN